ncbi:MAG: VanW family protein [Bacillota bacterium]
MQKKILITAIFVILVCFILLPSYANSGIIPANVYIEGVNIGGLSVPEAEKKVQENFKRIHFKYNTFSCSLLPEDIGININWESSMQNLKNKNLWKKIKMSFQETHFILDKKLDEKKMQQSLAAIAGAIEIPPQDAYLEAVNKEIVKRDGKWGSKVDLELLTANIQSGYLKTTYNIPVRSVPPKLTAKDLDQFHPDQLLGEYTTEFVKNFNRTENIKLACEALKNALIAPGQVFSFNEVVGPREAEKGYLNAMVIMGGEFTPGLGGGICQVSSTLYNSVLLAGLEIVERHPHSLSIDYVPLGRDATVTYGLKDFKFKNNTSGYLLLDYHISGQNLTISIYGTESWIEKVKVIDIVEHVLKTIQPAVREVVSPELLPGEIKVVNSGKLGYRVNTFRIIKIEGEEIRELLAEDYYQPQSKIIQRAAQ